MRELIAPQRGIGVVEATANDGYFTRSFCLLELFAIFTASGFFGVHNFRPADGAAEEQSETKAARVAGSVEQYARIVDSKSARASREEDRTQVAAFIESAGRSMGAADGHAWFDAKIAEGLMAFETNVAERRERHRLGWRQHMLRDEQLDARMRSAAE